MSRLATAVAVALVAPSLAHADPEPHAQGAWLELGIDSNFLVDDSVRAAVDLPTQQLSLGAQLEHVAIGVTTGFTHPPDGVWRVALGPTVRVSVFAAPGGSTELVVEGGILASVGLSSHDGQDGGPTLYTLKAGAELRYWLDPHLALGGGIVAHVLSHSEDMLGGSRSILDLGLGGALRVTGVF